MARRNYTITEEVIQRFAAQGRGQGEGVDYKPWLTVFDFPSRGRIHRLFGITVPREYHLFSDGEFDTFTQFDWRRVVTDIREQFPLDREITGKIARQIKERHPRTVDGTDSVLTTDFVLVVEKNGKREIVARTVKPEKELISRRVRVKFEIERRYWAYLKVNWAIVTERQRNSILVRNISGLRPFVDLTGLWAPYPGCFRDLVIEFLNYLYAKPGHRLHRCCLYIGDKFGVASELVYVAVRHLLVRKLVITNMLDPTPFPDRYLSDYVLGVSKECLYGLTIR